MARCRADDHAPGDRAIARTGAAPLALAAAALAVAALVATCLSLGVGVRVPDPGDAHRAVVTTAADDGLVHAVVPAVVTVVVASLVIVMTADSRLRRSLHGSVAARDRSPPASIGH
jgi:hypothetical protein